MFNLSSPPLPADVPATLQTLSDLVSLLADPAAAAKRVADLQAATAAFQQAADDHKTQAAGFAVAKADHQKALAAATAEQKAMLAAAQTEHDAACNARKAELDNRADQLSRLVAKAKIDADAAAVARAEYERRLDLVRQATG